MTGPGPRRDHPVFAAVYAAAGGLMEAGRLGRERRRLLSTATGVVVDLGAGTGANLAHLPATVQRLHLVEPDASMRRHLERRLAAAGLHVPVTVHAVGAERLPLPDGSADTVLSTLTMCTVQDPGVAAAEIVRVLRPGGRLLVLEHVRSGDPRRARGQDRLRALWGRFSGGCDPTRDTSSTLAAAGLDLRGAALLRVAGTPVVGDWLVGEAVRR